MMKEIHDTALRNDVCRIIEQGRPQAYAAVNNSMIATYWNIGRRISTQYDERHDVQPQLPMKEGEVNKFELLKNPIVAEFLGFKPDASFSEEELKRTEGDNPTIGIVLCSETSKDIARYAMLKGSEPLFAAKYKTYLPTEEQLRTEIERQKELFKLQHKSMKEGNV